MKITLWVSCFRGQDVGSSAGKTSFSREVDWPSIPRENDCMMVGTEGDVNVYVRRVFWGTNEIIVEGVIENLDATDEFDSVRQLIVEDGFIFEYGEPLKETV